MTRGGRIAIRLREPAGAEIAEAAVILPLVFLFIIGIYWFGRAFNIYTTINQAAREGARVAVAQSCATCGNAGATPTQVGTQVQSSLQASNLDPTQMAAPTATPPNGCGSLSTQVMCQKPPSLNMCVYYKAQLNSSTATPPAGGVVVAFKYPYQVYFPFPSLNFQQIQMTATVQMKGEY